MGYLTIDRVNATFINCLFRPEELDGGRPLLDFNGEPILDLVIGKRSEELGRILGKT